MKKLLLTLLVVGVVWGCVREWEYWDGEDEKELSVDDARSYFEENAEALSLMEQFASKDGASGTRSTDMPSVVLTPHWKEATSYHGKKVVIVDVPLLSNVRQSAFRQDKKGKSKSQNYEVPDIETRLMIVDTKRNDEPMRMVTVTMIPDFEGVKKAPKETRLLHPRNDLSGIVVLSDLEGVAFNVLELSRGKIVGRMGIVSDISQLEGREDYTAVFKRTDLKTPTSRRQQAGAESSIYEFVPGCPSCEAGFCKAHGYVQTDKLVVNGYDNYYTSPFFMYPYIGQGNNNYSWSETEIFIPPHSGSVGGVASGTPSNTETQTDSPSVLRAKTPFRNSTLTEEQWEVLGKMFNEIDSTPLGNLLLSHLAMLLKNKTILISFDPSFADEGQFEVDKTKITLRYYVGVEQRSDVLFEEMYHTLQAYYDPADWNTKGMNHEIEAGYAKYLYLKSLPGYSGSHWEERYNEYYPYIGMPHLNTLITDEGYLRPGASEAPVHNFLNALAGGYVTYLHYQGAFNNSIYGTNNFLTLQKLHRL